MATQPERISALETHRIWQWAAIVGVGGWLIWVSLTLIRVSGDLRAIKQKIKDGGLGDIVAQLREPKSSEQLQANLSTVIAQIQTARVNQTAPDHQKIKTLSGVLGEVVKRNPEVPEAWQAAVQMVDYKFQPLAASTSLPDCLNMPDEGHNFEFVQNSDGSRTKLPFPTRLNLGVPNHFTEGFRNCNLNLEDDGNFYSTVVGKELLNAGAEAKGENSIIFILNHVNIRYAGGKPLPITQIQFRDCSFTFVQPIAVPSLPAQVLTTQLLASGTSAGSLQLSASGM
jgi:hypothetical protein